jgi:hypothetical protein
MRLFRLSGGVLLAFACLLSAAAHAQAREIPGDAKRGEIRHVENMMVQIDGTPQRLAPGAQIRDAANRVVVPTALPAGAQVKYLLNEEGMVRQVWILTPEEAKQ